MESFQFTIDQKVVTIERMTFYVDAETQEEADAKIKQIVQEPFWHLCDSSEVLYDCTEPLQPSENGGMETIWVYRGTDTAESEIYNNKNKQA